MTLLKGRAERRLPQIRRDLQILEAVCEGAVLPIVALADRIEAAKLRLPELVAELPAPSRALRWCHPCRLEETNGLEWWMPRVATKAP